MVIILLILVEFAGQFTGKENGRLRRQELIADINLYAFVTSDAGDGVMEIHLRLLRERAAININKTRCLFYMHGSLCAATIPITRLICKLLLTASMT